MAFTAFTVVRGDLKAIRDATGQREWGTGPLRATAGRATGRSNLTGQTDWATGLGNQAGQPGWATGLGNRTRHQGRTIGPARQPGRTGQGKQMAGHRIPEVLGD